MSWQRTPLPVCAVLLAIALPPRGAASAEPSLGHCADLYRLWMRYEWHFTLHSGQKARADIALERDCQGADHARGVEELEKLLRRGRIPYTTREVSAPF
jgi:hypothetical protein